VLDPDRAAAMNHLMTSEDSFDVDLMIPEGDRALRVPPREHAPLAPEAQRRGRRRRGWSRKAEWAMALA
jgi:hypothetical protein